jgi:hypothetical protein
LAPAPPQAAPDHEEKAAEFPPIIDSGTPGDNGNYYSIRPIGIADSQIKIVMAGPPRGAIESADRSLHNYFEQLAWLYAIEIRSDATPLYSRSNMGQRAIQRHWKNDSSRTPRRRRVFVSVAMLELHGLSKSEDCTPLIALPLPLGGTSIHFGMPPPNGCSGPLPSIGRR